MFYVYVLLSEPDGRFYVGSTGDLRRRVTEHQRGNVASTKHRSPLILVCYEAYRTKHEAERRERYLKSSDGKKDLRRRLVLPKSKARRSY